MEDQTSNIIAWLFPLGQAESTGYTNAKKVVEAAENGSRSMPPLREVAEQPVYSRESTAQPEEDEDENEDEDGNEEDEDEDEHGYKYNRKQNNGSEPDWIYKPGLQLNFNHAVKGSKGITFGTEKKSDIFLPKDKSLENKISRLHCYLTFDNERRLVLKDCSSYGTIVEYDGQGGELRRNFTWILGGHRIPQANDKIIIQFHDYLRFQIVVFKHDTQPDLYVDNVNRFLQQTEINNMAGLGLGSNDPSRVSSKADTPGTDAIYLMDQTLGMGGFAVVSRHWNVSNGFYYAVKEPRDTRRGKFNCRLWQTEIDIMLRVSHVCLMRSAPLISSFN